MSDNYDTRNQYLDVNGNIDAHLFRRYVYQHQYQYIHIPDILNICRYQYVYIFALAQFPHLYFAVLTLPPPVSPSPSLLTIYPLV